MKESIEIKNLFTHLIFTRLIVLAIERNMNARYTESVLQQYLKNFPEKKISESAIHKKLQQTDKVHIFLTEELLNDLILILNKGSLSNLKSIEKFIEKSIHLSSVYGTFEYFKEHTLRINQLRENKDLPPNTKLIDISEYLEINGGPNISEIQNDVEQRVLELTEEEPIEVYGKRVSIDENNVLQILNLFLKDIPEDWYKLLENTFYKKTFNFNQCVQKLLRKGLLKRVDSRISLSTQMPYNLGTENIEYLRLTLDSLISIIEQNQIDALSITKLIYLQQSLGLYEHSGQMLDNYWSLIKHSGKYQTFSTILQRQIEFKKEEGTTSPWDLWAFANCQTYMGNIKNAIEYLTELIHYINENCRNKNGIQSKYLELYYKTFQLGIDIAIIGNNHEILINQLELVRYFTIQYFLLPQVSNEVNPIVRVQVLGTLGVYLHKIGDTNHAKDVLTNLREEFLQKESSLTKASILINYLSVFPDHFLDVKLKIINEAFYCFKFKNNWFGMYITSLWRASLLEPGDQKEFALRKTIEILENIDGYYPLSIELFGESLNGIQDEKLKSKCLRLLEKLKHKKGQIEKDIQSFPDLKILLAKDSNLATIIGADDTDTFGADKIRSVIKELSVPSYRKSLSFNSIDVQKLLNSNISNRKKFLSNTLNKLGNDYKRFYLLPEVKFVLTKSLHWRHEHKYLLHFYFSNTQIEEIKGLSNPSIILDYARSLTRLMPKASKELLDVLPYKMRNAEYYTLQGNYYSSLGPSFFQIAIECYNKAVGLCDPGQEKLLARIKTSLGFHIIKGNKYSPNFIKWAEKLFWEAIEIYKTPKISYYPFIGILYLRIDKNPSRVSEEFILQQLEYLKLNQDEKIYTLDKFLLGDKRFLITEYSCVYNVLKSLVPINVNEL